MWRHFVTSHQVDVIFFYGSLLPLCGSVVRVNQRDITMMSHFCHLKPRLILYHSFVLRLWPNWYSQLNVLNPTAFTQLRQFWAHFVQVNSVGCWMMAANWAMRVPLTGSGREVLLTVQCSWARLEWTGKDDAGGRREAGGRPLNTRTAEQVVDVRSSTTVIDVFPPIFSDRFRATLPTWLR